MHRLANIKSIEGVLEEPPGNLSSSERGQRFFLKIIYRYNNCTQIQSLQYQKLPKYRENGKAFQADNTFPWSSSPFVIDRLFATNHRKFNSHASTQARTHAHTYIKWNDLGRRNDGMIPIIIVVTSTLWYVSIATSLLLLVLLALLLLVVFSHVLCSIRVRGIFNNRQKSTTYLCPVAIPHTWNTNLATSSRGIV